MKCEKQKEKETQKKKYEKKDDDRLLFALTECKEYIDYETSLLPEFNTV